MQLIDFLTPRYHSNSSSTKALCPFQIIRSKELYSRDKAPTICLRLHTPFLFFPLCLSPCGKTRYFAVFTAFWVERCTQQMATLWELVSECIIPVQQTGSDQYVCLPIDECGGKETITQLDKKKWQCTVTDIIIFCFFKKCYITLKKYFNFTGISILPKNLYYNLPYYVEIK